MYTIWARDGTIGWALSRVRFPIRSLDFSLAKSFCLHYSPGVDSASNLNLFQKYLLVRTAENLATFMYRLSRNPRSLYFFDQKMNTIITCMYVCMYVCMYIYLCMYCILLYFGRVPAANAPGCTSAEGLFYRPWSLVLPTCAARCLHQRL